MGAGQAMAGSYFAYMNFPARYTDPVYIVTITSSKILMHPRVAPIGATPRPFGPRGGCIITHINQLSFICEICPNGQKKPKWTVYPFGIWPPGT